MYKPIPPTISQLKNKILRPATTSNYQCWFPPPVNLLAWFEDKRKAGLDINFNVDTLELISLNCMEASLPGSTFLTNEITDDYTGVTERHAYRRQYDDRADFTFQVDNSVNAIPNSPEAANYRTLLFFELWMQYIVDEQEVLGMRDPNYFYRVNYPYKYQTPYIIINKFEKDYRGNYLQYKFLQAFPIAVNSIPVSNDSSQILKCTVSFTYTRYIIDTFPLSGLPRPNTPAPQVTVLPSPNITPNPPSQSGPSAKPNLSFPPPPTSVTNRPQPDFPPPPVLSPTQEPLPPI